MTRLKDNTRRFATTDLPEPTIKAQLLTALSVLHTFSSSPVWPNARDAAHQSAHRARLRAARRRRTRVSAADHPSQPSADDPVTSPIVEVRTIAFAIAKSYQLRNDKGLTPRLLDRADGRGPPGWRRGELNNGVAAA